MPRRSITAKPVRSTSEKAWSGKASPSIGNGYGQLVGSPRIEREPTSIHQYWEAPEIPEEIEEQMAGFDLHSPQLVRMLHYRAGVEFLIKDERHGARVRDALAACAVPAMRADLCGYLAVHAEGGIYADARLRCIGDVETLLDGAPDGILFGWRELPADLRPLLAWREQVEPYRAIAGALYAFPKPRHPLLELAIELAAAYVEEEVADEPVLLTGPAIFTSLYLLRELGSIEAYRDYVRGGPLEAAAPVFAATVGSPELVTRSFDSVRIAPIEEAGKWFELDELVDLAPGTSAGS